MSGQTDGIYNASKNQVPNGITPKVANVYSFPITLIANAAQVIDLKTLANLNRISNVQGIFIDNSANGTSFSVQTTAGQRLQIPAGYQGVMPLYLSQDGTLTLNGGGTVQLTLLNFPTPAAVWPATSSSTIVTISGTVQVQDTIAETALANLQPGIPLTSRSIASTTANASTQLMAANTGRKYVMIGAPQSSEIWINMLGGTAGVGLVDSFQIPPGGKYESANYISTSQINYFITTAALVLPAYEG